MALHNNRYRYGPSIGLLTWIFMAFILMTSQSVASAFDDARAAFKRGDYQTAVQLVQPLAEQGDAEAQYALGTLYQTGKGVKQDFVKAMYWMVKSAKQGNAAAESNIGLMYQNGLGVKKNFAKALLWYRKAAERGDVFSECALGLMYVRGDGTPVDNVEAVKWLRKAAEQDYQTAQGALANRYEKGQGVKIDYGEIYFWLTLYERHGTNYSGDNDRQIEDAAKHLTPEQLSAVKKRLEEWKPKASNASNP